MKRVVTILTIAFVFALGCGKKDKDPDKDKTPEKDKGAESKTYDIKGEVVALDAEKKSITLDHEEVPGLMKGMKMSFDVPDAKVLEGIKAGDKVHGKLRTKDGKYTILELHKL